MDFVSILSIFVMACFVGYYVVWSVMASVNIFGGFAVTERMLAMYKKKDKK